jgi:two-component system sensor histidine kinase ChvG
MASDTDTAKREPVRPRRRRGWTFGGRLGRLIAGLNLLSLLILIGGALVLNELRQGLIQTRLDSLLTQGELIAGVIVETGTRGAPEPALEPLEAALALRDNFIPRGQRARLFDRDGLMLLDSYTVSEEIERTTLPPARRRDAPAPRDGDAEKHAEEIRRARAALDAEIRQAIETGRPVTGVRVSESGEQVVSVSIPIQRVKAVLGVLTLEAGDVDEIIAAQRLALLPFALVAIGVSLLSSLLLNRFVARPILRLAEAADQVRASKARVVSLPDLEERRDEIGDLAFSVSAMTDALSQRMDAIERFAADVSHEIKNPLTSIRSALETLDLVKDEAAKARLVAMIKQDVGRLNRLITDISNASRLDAELSRDAPRPIDLGRLLADVAGTYGEFGGPGEARVVFSADAGPASVVGREGPLGQVFRNLIDNARSFSPEGGEVRVRLTRDAAGGATPLVVTVDDDGPGVPPENLETVFQRFYTSRPKGAAFGGNSGLGLSIARQIVETHGGAVVAQNRTGPDGTVAGARFVVRLPEAAT